MTKALYTARAHVTGGRAAGHGRSADGRLDVQLRLPQEMGGNGDGTNPEELFAVGYAACFEGVLGAVSRRRELELGDIAIDSQVSLIPDGKGGLSLAVVLDVSLGAIEDPASAVAIVREAHEMCPYSNATRGNIAVSLSANGAPLD
ncbi:MAG: organic hydroperoxide resistance protein [Solirubrobacteraceae bacterium]|jgi:Ohr subfamily peroxiredoxin